jgi:hypothetical protein
LWVFVGTHFAYSTSIKRKRLIDPSVPNQRLR